MNGGSGDAVALGQLPQALPALEVPQDGGVIKFKRLAPDVAAFEPGAPHAGADPLDNKVALKLSDGSDDDDHGGPAARRCRVVL